MGFDPAPIVRVFKDKIVRAAYAQQRDTIVPRNIRFLIVCIVARISGGPRQKEMSLEDQVDHAKEIVAEFYSGPVEFRVIATKAKGEWRDRPELLLVEEQLRSREIDLLFLEDIGRLIRGADAVTFVGIAVDHGTRVLAPNDCIDTADADWEEDVIQACRDHVGHNSHCSKRIKKKKMARFKRFGGATPCEVAGYLKPDGAKSFDDWKKLPEWTPVIREGLRILKETLNCSRVAAHFNSTGFPLGKYSRSIDGKWLGRMVRRFYKNRILGGFPGRGHRHTIKHHERGRRISVPNPDGAIFIERPHLAHVDIAELDEVNTLLQTKNANLGRKTVNGADPRLFVPRKTTVFPSQHARCWYCGFTFVRGANGMTDHVMCSNCRDWHCWNSFGVDCGLASTKVMAAIMDTLHALDGIDDQYRELVQQAHCQRVGCSAERWKKLEGSEERLRREMDNLVHSIAQFGPVPELGLKLDELKQQQTLLAAERQRMENVSKRELRLPSSIAELRGEFERQAEQLAIDSPAFGDLMRQLIPEFHVYLVRLLDGGHPMPRVRIKLDFAGCLADLGLVPDLSTLLTRVLTLDLFVPPQRERIREEAVRLAALPMKQRDIAKQLSEPTFQAVVQKALALDRLMKDGGHTSPYEVLLAPPADYLKLRRHLNRQYKFLSLDGYERPPI